MERMTAAHASINYSSTVTQKGAFLPSSLAVVFAFPYPHLPKSCTSQMNDGLFNERDDYFLFQMCDGNLHVQHQMKTPDDKISEDLNRPEGSKNHLSLWQVKRNDDDDNDQDDQAEQKKKTTAESPAQFMVIGATLK